MFVCKTLTYILRGSAEQCFGFAAKFAGEREGDKIKKAVSPLHDEADDDDDDDNDYEGRPGPSDDYDESQEGFSDIHNNGDIQGAWVDDGPKKE